jgi:FAD/FMN-containing dehydrogenase
MKTQPTRAIDPARVSTFQERFLGEVVLPVDAGYDAARAVWNAMIDRRPAIVVRPTSPQDVMAALRFAREMGLVIAVRCGGHSLPGLSTCDDGIVIDLSRMRGVRVDPERRIARVAGGTLLGELDTAAQGFGLACNVGTVSHTGVAGLTLGGGMGRLQRKLGLTIDSLRAVELVTADGRLVRASEDENADLFWGVRGAGPNFGIVTAFEFGLHPVGPTIVRGILTYPGERAREVVGAFRDTMTTAPDDLMASLIIGRAIDAERYPTATPGAPIVTVSLTWAGRLDLADAALSAFTALGPPIAGSVGRQTYLASQGANDVAMAWGHRVYTKSGYVGSIPETLVDTIVGHASAAPGDDVFSIWAFGGAVGRVCEDATAFTGRTAPFWIGAEAEWDDAALDGAHVAWARAGIALTEPYRVMGGYVNDVSEAGDDAAVLATYGPEKLGRLVALKRAWDPDNVFRLNQNIRP